jgi:clan AA aspartic protease (TIGR02281 family)
MYMKLSRCGCMLIGMLLVGHAWADGSCQLKNYGTLPVDIANSQPTVVTKVNGADTRFIVRTGATYSVMAKSTATSLGLSLQPVPGGLHMSGPQGNWAAHATRVQDFDLLGPTLHDVEFLVGGSDMGYGMLGANMLDASDMELDLARGKLLLFTSDGCGDSPLAYWVTGHDYYVAKMEALEDPHDLRTYLDIMVNGKRLRALLDSGAPVTAISRNAAERVGIDLNGPGVKATLSPRIGAPPVKTWAVNVDTFSIGNETIQHSAMQVVDENFGDHQTDVLLGLDFLLAHRMYIANTQRMVYFTYNGGRVSALAAASGDSGKVDPAASGDDKDSAPKSANDYAVAGEAHLSRGETKAAFADLDEAIRLSPDQASYYFARARAHAAEHQRDAVLADLDKSLLLDPKNVDALLMRAGVHLADNDSIDAATDVAAATPLLSSGASQARLTASLDLELEQPAAALPLLDDWIRTHDNDPMLGRTLGERCWARALSNQLLDDALTDCHKSIARDGEKPGNLSSLGMVELRLKHYPESIKAYQQAIVLAPRSGWAHYGLGLAQIQAGQADAGNAELATARMINPQLQARAEKYGLSAAAP